MAFLQKTDTISELGTTIKTMQRRFFLRMKVARQQKPTEFKIKSIDSLVAFTLTSAENVKLPADH